MTRKGGYASDRCCCLETVGLLIVTVIVLNCLHKLESIDARTRIETH